MPYATSLGARRYTFDGLREVFAKASERKAGDELAGLAAADQSERIAAKFALAEVSLAEIVENPLVDPTLDEVSRLIHRTHDPKGFASIKGLTIGAFRDWLLCDAVGQSELAAVRWALVPEIAAAVSKLMSNKDLISVASKIRVETRCRNTMGQAGVIGCRIQPNHPADDLAGIVLAAIDGLLMGCGDAVIGVNPATESIESTSDILSTLSRLIETTQAPTQSCCLAHITTQLAAMERGAPVDLLFQSIAGTEAANSSFGVSLALLDEARQRVLEHHLSREVQWIGGQVMYFETGQGSALSAGAHHGVDQTTLEARAYGVARAFDPFLVNSVVGFIGPEYLADERQIIRAGLEDHFMGKLLGLPMGCDVCFTAHADADSNSTDNLLVLLAAAGCNYFMGVPCSDDIMLNYQSTSYHDILSIRKLFHQRSAPEFEAWLFERGLHPLERPASQLSRIQTSLRSRMVACSRSGSLIREDTPPHGSSNDSSRLGMLCRCVSFDKLDDQTRLGPRGPIRSQRSSDRGPIARG